MNTSLERAHQLIQEIQRDTLKEWLQHLETKLGKDMQNTDIMTKIREEISVMTSSKKSVNNKRTKKSTPKPKAQRSVLIPDSDQE